MKHYKLAEMVKGWFVGNFEPSVFCSNDCEVGVKHYRQGDIEPEHYHKLATEITVVVVGKVKMLDKEWGPGDIIVLSPGEITAFEALEDAITTVVKLPATKDDKYLV